MKLEEVREVTLNKDKKKQKEPEKLLPGQQDGVPGYEKDTKERLPPLGDESYLEIFLKRPTPQSGEPTTLLDVYWMKFLDKPAETETNPSELGGGGQQMQRVNLQPFDTHMPFQFFPGSRVYDYQTREKGIVTASADENSFVEILSEGGATRKISTMLLKPMGCSIREILAGELFFIPDTALDHNVSVLKMIASNETELEFVNVVNGKNYKVAFKDMVVVPVDRSIFNASVKVAEKGYTDKFGVTWYLPKEELCPECGQPDSCGDCNHTQLSEEDVKKLKQGSTKTVTKPTIENMYRSYGMNLIHLLNGARAWHYTDEEIDKWLREESGITPIITCKEIDRRAEEENAPTKTGSVKTADNENKNYVVCDMCGQKVLKTDYATQLDHMYVKHNAKPDKEDTDAHMMVDNHFQLDPKISSVKTAEEPGEGQKSEGEETTPTDEVKEEDKKEPTEGPQGGGGDMPSGDFIPGEMGDNDKPGIVNTPQAQIPQPAVVDKTKDMDPMDKDNLSKFINAQSAALRSLDMNTYDSMTTQIRAILEKYQMDSPTNQGLQSTTITTEGFLGAQWGGMNAPRRDYSILLKSGMKAIDAMGTKFGVFVSGLGIDRVSSKENGIKPKTGIIDFSANVRYATGINRKLLFRVAVDQKNIQLMPFFSDSLGRQYKLSKESLAAYLGTGEDIEKWTLENYPNQP